LGRVLPRDIQLRSLKRRFSELNPQDDIQEVDWGSAVAKRETFSESLEAMRYEYPQFSWLKKKDPYAGMAIEQLRKEAEPYKFRVISQRELNAMKKHGSEAKRGHLKHHTPGVKPTKRREIVFVHEYNRRWAKR
jgi:hypothetical protein